MTLSERIFLYCERGTRTEILAEPLNAASNAAFLIAALAGLWLLLRRPAEERSPDHYLLIALVFLVGFGSLSFHLAADQLTGLADMVPIGVFTLVYLGFALNRFLNVPSGWTVLLVVGFAVVVFVTVQLRCFDSAIGFPVAGGQEGSLCLNGSLGYVPALIALLIVGALLRERGHPAAPYLLWGGLVFAVSITLRSVDLAVCETLRFQGRAVGTHFVWHVLNAITMFLLLRASLETGPSLSLHEPPRREMQKPEAQPS